MNESSKDNKPTKLSPLDESVDQALAEISEAAEDEIQAVAAAAEETDPDGSLAFGEMVALEVQAKKSDIVHEDELHGIRKIYTGKLFALTCVWLSFVLLFVILTGLRTSIHIPMRGARPLAVAINSDCPDCWNIYFSLSDKVLIAFITSTTATVVGIFLIVAKWLFPSPKADHKEKSAEVTPPKT